MEVMDQPLVAARTNLTVAVHTGMTTCNVQGGWWPACCRRWYALVGFDRRTFGKYGDAKAQAGRQCALRTAKHVEGKGIVVGH